MTGWVIANLTEYDLKTIFQQISDQITFKRFVCKLRKKFDFIDPEIDAEQIHEITISPERFQSKQKVIRTILPDNFDLSREDFSALLKVALDEGVKLSNSEKRDLIDILFKKMVHYGK